MKTFFKMYFEKYVRVFCPYSESQWAPKLSMHDQYSPKYLILFSTEVKISFSQILCKSFVLNVCISVWPWWPHEHWPSVYWTSCSTLTRSLWGARSELSWLHLHQWKHSLTHSWTLRQNSVRPIDILSKQDSNDI